MFHAALKVKHRLSSCIELGMNLYPILTLFRHLLLLDRAECERSLQPVLKILPLDKTFSAAPVKTEYVSLEDVEEVRLPSL